MAAAARRPGWRVRLVVGIAVSASALGAATTGGTAVGEAPPDDAAPSLPDRWIRLGSEVETIAPFGIGRSAANDINQSGRVVGDITEVIPLAPPADWTEDDEVFEFDVQTGEFEAPGLGSVIDYTGAGYDAVSETLVAGWIGGLIEWSPFSMPTAAALEGGVSYDFVPLYLAQSATFGAAYGVNDNGTVVGAVGEDFWGLNIAFRVSSPDGSDVALIAPEAARSIAWDVSNTETIVGEASFGDETHAFLLREGEVDLLDLGTLPGGTSSAAVAINDGGTLIVGNSNAAGPASEAFVYDVASETMTSLGPGTVASDVNDVGLVVGSRDGRAFIYDVASDTLTDVHDPAAGTWSHLNAIDDSGRIAVGSAQFGTTHGRAAVLTPWSFVDVPGWHRFHDDIEWLADNDIAQGYAGYLFKPGIQVTRQAMAAFLYRYSGSPAFTPPVSPTFDDVPADHPFFTEIEWLASEGIADGFSDGTYRPASTITRQSMAALLYQMAKEPAFTPPVTPTFSDVSAGHPFFAEIEWLASIEVTTGFDDGTYQPTKPVTRQAYAAFQHRFDVALG